MKWPFTKLPMKYFDDFQEFWVPLLSFLPGAPFSPLFLTNFNHRSTHPPLVVSYKQRALSIRTKTSANPRAAPICSEASPPRNLPKRKGLRNKRPVDRDRDRWPGMKIHSPADVDCGNHWLHLCYLQLLAWLWNWLYNDPASKKCPIIASYAFWSLGSLHWRIEPTINHFQHLFMKSMLFLGASCLLAVSKG